MSKGGSQTSSTSIDPDVKKAFLANFEQAKNVAGALPVQEFAGFNPMYEAGERQLINTGLAGPGLANIDRAAQMTAEGAQYQPGMVGGFNAGPASLADAQGYGASQFAGAQAGPASLAGAQGYGASQFAGAQAGPAALAGSQGYGATDVSAAQANMGDIGRYMNPYTSGVIDASLADIEKARAAASSRIGQQAAAAKAFGGSRQALAQGASSGQFAEQAAKTAAQLRAQGFDVAANQMQQDLARQQQAAIQNASQRTAASQFGAGAANQAALANAAARNQMAQFNAGNLQQAGLSNVAAQNVASQFGAGAANQAALANAAARNQMAQFNAGNLQQAGLSNVAAQNAASQFGAGAANQAALANAAARNQMSQFNTSTGQQAALANQQAGLQGAQLRLGGANQLGNLAAQQQALRFSGAQAAMGAGSARQAQDQQRMDAIRNIGLQRLGIVQSSLGANPANLGMTTQTPYSQNTGAGLLGGALAGSQLAGLTGGAISGGMGAGLGALLALI